MERLKSPFQSQK